MIDNFSFAAPARTRVLVVPLNPSDPHFKEYYDAIRRANDIRLLDVAPLPECRNFNPQTFPQGRVFYDFSTADPEEDVSFLHDFEPFRKTFIVLGLGSYKDYHENALNTLAGDHQTAVVHNCIYFNAPAERIEEKDPSGQVFFVPALADQNVTTLETTVCSVTRNYISALASYVLSYEKITLRSPVSLRDGTALHKTITYAQKKVNSGSSFKVSFAKSQASQSNGPDSKVKASQRQTGRQAKLTGNFLLLAGQANEASQYFTDAAINLKKADDNLWLGSALEGLAVASMMLAYLGLPHQASNPMLASVLHISKSKISSAGLTQMRLSSESVASRPSNVQTPRNSTSSSRSVPIISSTTTTSVLASLSIVDFLRLLCNKTAMFYYLSDADFENCVPDLVHIEFLLRSVRLFVAFYLAGGESEHKVLSAVIKSTPVVPHGPKDPAAKAEIITLIDQIFNMQLIDLEFFKQCRVYHTLAQIYADLGLRRKRAFILRILLVALLPKLNYKTLQTEFASPKSLANTFEYLFETYQIGKETEASEIAAYGHHSDWITLQLSILRICLRISEAQKDYETLAKLCVLFLSRYTHCLPKDDQIKLKRKLDWLSLVFKENQQNYQIPHPDPFLVRNAKFVLQSSTDELVPLQTLNSTATSTNEPLIFNPFSKLPQDLPSKENLICINELHHIIVLLQNPFAFDLSISDITILSDDESAIETIKSSMRVVGVSGFNKQDLNRLNGGLVFQPNRLYEAENTASGPSGNITVPQSSLCHVIVGFKIHKPGKYKISEIDITFGTSQPQRFSIIDQEKWRKFECSTQQSDSNVTSKGQENSILDKCVSNLAAKNTEGRASKKSLSITVIPSQASLSLVANSLANGWIMLLEGEDRDFSIKLKNTSELAINYLSFSFWDSTNDAINSRLNHASSSSSMQAEDIHELEWRLLESKPFTVLNKSEIASKYKIIQPQDVVEFKFQMHGKRGMSESRLILEYCNKTSDEKTKNYVKNICVPFNVTVQPSLEIIGCDIIPFFSTSLQGFKLAKNSLETNIEKNISELLKFISDTKEAEDDDISQYCLLMLDVKNLWKEKLELRITNKVSSDGLFEVKEVVEPSKATRLLIPVQRINLEEIDTSRPIPSLRKKQFIKNYSITAEEDEQSRKNFWIRSTLEKGLSGSWRSPGRNSRCGSLDLKSIRLDNRMTNALVYDSISIQHSIWTLGNEPKVIEKKENEYILDKEKFYTLKTRIVNHTKTKLTGVLRHVPFPSSDSNKSDNSIDQRIFFNGVLQKFVGPNYISPGESLEFNLGFMVLEKGRYEWGSVFDSLNNSGKKTVGREPVYITVI